ncbi:MULTISPECIES: porin [unclassified Duganella]|uniref:porin n=1 Tax=unclassified Duganella TaxID=2636909 RepID=UPI0006FA00E7|nr:MULTISPECIES: porin [unclassified Duganella]KQV54455.1 porin [Duganella sp. Root336D2]KRC03581.1 porin [Duganella sp. Root198D2]
MKRTSMAAAVAMMFAAYTSAHAQSNVQVYGLLDMGVDISNNAQAGGGSVTHVSSGGMNTSRWGIKGSEDLGGGLKAVFQLESGILMDTGAQDGNLFKRQANVGLEGNWGRVILGRSFTSVYDTVIRFDPMGFAPYYSWATGGSATLPSKYGMTTGFDNLIKYSGKTGDWNYGFSYGMGEQQGAGASSADSAKYAGAVSYQSESLGAMFTAERINGNNVVATGNRDETTAYHLGGYYATGDFKFWLGGRTYKLVAGKAATADVKGNTLWAGVAYKPQPNVTITGAVYHIDQRNLAAGKDADPTMYVLRYRYAASKRTDLYATVGYTKGKHDQLVGLSRDDAAFGDSQHGVMVGIQHRF